MFLAGGIILFPAQKKKNVLLSTALQYYDGISFISISTAVHSWLIWVGARNMYVYG